jgi:ATP-dependent Clp protease protease subunit
MLPLQSKKRSMVRNEFEKYAVRHLGLNSLTLHDYTSQINNGYFTPNIIEERQLNAVAMDVFSRLMMDRMIFLGVPIYSDVANILIAQLLFLDSIDNSKDIQIYFNTPGGSIYDGLAIYDTIQTIGSDVATICTGIAASMGAVLICAGTQGKRTALKHSRIMIHQPMGGAEGQASDILITAHQIKLLKQELYDIISKHSGKPVDVVEKDADRDYWMTAAEAQDYGMIDRIIDSKTK